MAAAHSIRTVMVCVLVAFMSSGILSCSGNDGLATASARLQGAVDTVRKDLETKLGRAIPSLNVLIEGPTGTHFTSSASHPFTAAELVQQVTDHKLSSFFLPGTGYQYSDTGYTILGKIIARVYTHRSGSLKTYTDYLHDHIYGPNSRVHVAFHFPYRATGPDTTLPNPFCCGHILNPGPGEFAFNCENNMSANVAEGEWLRDHEHAQSLSAR